MSHDLKKDPVTAVRIALLAVCLAVSACSTTPKEPQFRAYDLELSQPSSHANYLTVTPAARGADLPKPEQLYKRSFSTYLRNSTGCVVDTARLAAFVGNKSVPAAYTVPVLCH